MEKMYRIPLNEKLNPRRFGLIYWISALFMEKLSLMMLQMTVLCAKFSNLEKKLVS